MQGCERETRGSKMFSFHENRTLLTPRQIQQEKSIDRLAPNMMEPKRIKRDTSPFFTSMTSLNTYDKSRTTFQSKQGSPRQHKVLTPHLNMHLLNKNSETATNFPVFNSNYRPFDKSHSAMGKYTPKASNQYMMRSPT